MNKQLIAIGIIVVLLVVGLYGCMEKSPNSEKVKFIGKWAVTDCNAPADLEYEHEVTFYDNDTAKDYYWYEDGSGGEPVTAWLNYHIDDGILCLTQVDGEEDNSICWRYEFSNDYKTINLTFIDAAGFDLIFTKIIE